MTHVTCSLTAKDRLSAPEPYAPQSSMGHVFTLGDVVRNSGDCLDKRDRSRIIAGKKEKEDTRGFGTGT